MPKRFSDFICILVLWFVTLFMLTFAYKTIKYTVLCLLENRCKSIFKELKDSWWRPWWYDIHWWLSVEWRCLHGKIVFVVQYICDRSNLDFAKFRYTRNTKCGPDNFPLYFQHIKDVILRRRSSTKNAFERTNSQYAWPADTLYHSWILVTGVYLYKTKYLDLRSNSTGRTALSVWCWHWYKPQPCHLCTHIIYRVLCLTISHNGRSIFFNIWYPFEFCKCTLEC